MADELIELSTGFEPSQVEARWYKHWRDAGVFRASDEPGDTRPTYVLPMPLPNVTGSLHMGHAMMCTLEDVLTRVHRMRGFNTLYQPGTDHAGIATQVVVERQLKREGKTRHDLGRDAFIARVWQWKQECGNRIVEQQQVLGLSADWDRAHFTMDPAYSRAVREAFVRLYHEGLIYRGKRLVYWDCEARTVLSNLEVVSEEENGELYEFAYPVENDGGEIVVATTRPETMLGDTAVAVHPDDERYTHLHGKHVVHPFNGRRIPIITDAILVDPKFGTGAVKVTPAHDFNDFATGQRHNLEQINILELDGKINAEGAPFTGQDRFEARKAVKRGLTEKGLTRGSKNHRLPIPRSERTASVVEPLLSEQWFVKTEPLAGPALQAVREGRTVIIPEEWTKTYEHWMTNIVDWCISRQLWWGHRIPAWYCPNGHVTVKHVDRLDACPECGGAVAQDEDVLDTWFSSALWPFATQGWPEATPQLARFYPASDLETGSDILFFWVARMMMMGIHFMGAPPFKRILLHAIVVDETGEKMSKVKGNVIDPLDLIHGATFEAVVQKALPGAPLEEALAKFKKAYPSTAKMGQGFEAYGTDAVRWTLCSYSPQSKRVPLSPKRMEGFRRFCNKIWNATRFALPYLEGAVVGAEPPRPTALANRWLLSQLAQACATFNQAVDDFRFDDATAALYRFVWGDLCDWYVELCKPVFADPSASRETKDTLAYALEVALRAIHPIMPFITEELWHLLPRPPGSPGSIAQAQLPQASAGRPDADAERDMGILQAVITAARTIRSERDVKPKVKVPLILRSSDERLRQLLAAERGAIEKLVNSDDVRIEPSGGERPSGAALNAAAGVEVLVLLKGIVEAGGELQRIDREIKKTEKNIAALEKKLGAKGFADRAPPEVVKETHAELAAMRIQRTLLDEAKKLASEL